MTKTTNDEYKNANKIGRMIVKALRHDPQSLNVKLDDAGWTLIDELIRQIKLSGYGCSKDLLNHIVETNDKKRLTISPDGRKIRAAQGHSIHIDLGLIPVEPPEVLFHGTATHHLDSIFKNGLRPGSRQHVHLSPDHDTAVNVGGRHGHPYVLSIRAREAYRAGFLFFQADNGVWLTNELPADFISAYPLSLSQPGP